VKDSSNSLIKIVGWGTFWGSFGNIISKFIGLATVFIILRHYSTYEYGTIQLVMSAYGMLGFFLLPGMSNVVVSDMGIEKSKGDLSMMKSIYWNFFYLQSMLAIVAWIIFFGLATYISQLYNVEIANLVRITSFLFLLSPLRALFQVLFSVYLNFFERTTYSLLEELGKLCILSFLVFFLKVGMESIVYSTVLSQLVPMLIMTPVLFKVYSNLKLIPKQRLHIFHLLFNHGKWGVMLTYLNGLGQNIRIWTIKFFLGTDAVGIFSLASGLLGHVSSLISLSNVMSSIIPQYVNQKEKFRKIIDKSIKYQVIIYTYIGISAALILPPIFSKLFPNYIQSFPMFRLLLITMIPNGMASILTTIFNSLKAQKDMFYSTVIKTVIVVIFSPLLIIIFGFYGIALEYILTTLVFLFERYLRLRKYGLDLSSLLKDFFLVDSYDYIVIRKIRSGLDRFI
jgi:O-antigen/teichoic acid export membrane protein